MARARFVALAAALASVAAQTVPVTNVTRNTRACQPPYNSFPFCDTSLSIDARVKDIVARIIAQPEWITPQLTARHGGGGSPGPNDNVTALGLPELDWGMNAIHGVQSSCVQTASGAVFCPTSFPNPVNYGMSFNKSLVYDLGAIIGVETRALWLAGAVEASTWSGRPHIGLDAWSPNININRDPRWGRNVEVASEDPLINGIFGTQYTQGIQFNSVDNRYLQAVVTLKHWDAYSLEDSDGFERYNFDANVTNYGLADTFFPAFKKSVLEGQAHGIMCSYNALNGIPTCASPFLAHVLRDVWGFEGYQTSDSGALEYIFQAHHYVKTIQEAACVSIHDGRTDMCSGTTFAEGLLQGVQQGLCNMTDVENALYNTFKLRFQLGLFDPIDNQPFWNVPVDAINTAASQANNWLATLSSFVLLKHDNQVLPLPKGKRIAVIGPHANATTAMAGNYLGQLCPDNGFDCIVSPFEAISTLNVGGTTQMNDDCPISKYDNSSFPASVALAAASDYVVLMLGIDGTVEGESMDRTSIDLPQIQHDLAAAIVAVGKPVVMFVFNGGMVDVTPEKASVDAIIEAGYPGMLGGQAVAATIFGENDHLGGKLPYTIYPANYVNEIMMDEMEMDVGVGRSYRYYNGSVVYPFGWGLSLTTFSLTLNSGPGPAVTLPTEASPSRNLTFTVYVQNTGSVTGDEVIMAFFAPTGLTAQPQNRLMKQIFDYERVHLAPGEQQALTFTVSTETLRLVDKATGNIISTPGQYSIIFTNGVSNTFTASTITLQGTEVVVDPFPALPADE